MARDSFRIALASLFVSIFVVNCSAGGSSVTNTAPAQRVAGKIRADATAAPPNCPTGFYCVTQGQSITVTAGPTQDTQNALAEDDSGDTSSYFENEAPDGVTYSFNPAAPPFGQDTQMTITTTSDAQPQVVYPDYSDQDIQIDESSNCDFQSNVKSSCGWLVEDQYALIRDPFIICDMNGFCPNPPTCSSTPDPTSPTPGPTPTGYNPIQTSLRKRDESFDYEIRTHLHRAISSLARHRMDSSDGSCPVPTPTPTPSPVVAVDIAPDDGEFGLNDHGSVAISSASTSASLAYEPDETSAATAASLRRQAAAGSPSPRSLPSGYATAPAYLTLSAIQTAAIESSLLFYENQNAGECVAAILRARGNAGVRFDPTNPLYYQVQTRWLASTYNAQHTTASYEQTEQFSAAGGDPFIPDGVEYATPVQLNPLFSGHSEINKPVNIEVTLTQDPNKTYPANTQSFSKAFLNNRSVPYPVVPIPSSWGPSSSMLNGEVAPPTSALGTYSFTAKGCGSNVKRASAILTVSLGLNGYLVPALGFQAHHVKPSCWGGDNDYSNGIFLPTNAQGYPNEHQYFTTWWSPQGNFTP